MMLFRPAAAPDLEMIYNLALKSGIGMTTLPKDKQLLKTRLAWAESSFKKAITEPNDEYYLFVLEDIETQKVVGTSAIEAKTGVNTPFYSYKVSKRTRVCHSLNIRSDYEVLSLVNDNQNRSELCTLFLDPDYRKGHNGILLSKGRFLFIGNHPERFCPLIIAEMRGISDEKGISPFWEHIGRHFFKMEFSEADQLTISTNKQFIADLIPRNPIYIKLLAQEAQNVIGQPHQSTIPALNILLNEGFRFNQYVDIFDAGPTIEAPTSEIKSIKHSHVVTIKSLSDEVSGSEYLLASEHPNFRASIAVALFNGNQSSCIISKETAELLKVNKGEQLRIAPLKIQHPLPLL